MKTAFLILCHRDPGQINALAEKLSQIRGSDIYIHVDLNHPEVRKGILPRENLRLIPEERSFPIRWGGVDMVRATLQLIREARDSGTDYDYLWLMSGQDYLICPAEEIERRLASSPGTSYIDVIPAGDQRCRRYMKRCQLPYPAWINGRSPAVKLVKYLYMLVTGGRDRTFAPLIRKSPVGQDFSFGSQWWTLTSRAAYDVLDRSDRDPQILRFFEKSIIPDECFFQTLFMQGPYKDRRMPHLTFVSWEPDARSPRILTEKDLDLLREKSEHYCAARKFDIFQSRSLMDALDRQDLRA